MFKNLLENFKTKKTEPFSSPLIQKISENKKGNDFIFGDIHGRYTLFQSLLKKIKFNLSKDRVFCVGDLTDRGNENYQCLGLLENSWFHNTLGNHDEALALLVLEVLKDIKPAYSIPHLQDLVAFAMTNGGGWLLEDTLQNWRPIKRIKLIRSVHLLRNCPRIWVVGEGENRYHIVHATLVSPEKKDNVNPCLTDLEINILLEKNGIDYSLPHLLNDYRGISRMECQEELPKESPGLSKTFCGHTPSKTPEMRLSHFNLDTGKETLTCINSKTLVIAQAQSLKNDVINPGERNRTQSVSDREKPKD